jgi:hypothetical protein
MNYLPYVSADEGWNRALKLSLAIASAITPKSYPYNREPREAKTPTRNYSYQLDVSRSYNVIHT